MNLALIIAWLIFIAVLLAMLGLDCMKEEQSKLKFKTVLSSKGIQAIRDHAGSAFMGYYPETKINSLSVRLLWAGEPWGLTAQSFIGIQFSLLILGVIVGLNLSVFNIPFVLTLIISAILFFIPNLLLNEKVQKRQKEIEKDIPNMVGLLATSIKAGVELIPSLQAISANMPGALGDELRRAWNENATGKQLTKALHDMATRTGVDILKSFVETIITAQERGVSDLSRTLTDFSNTVLEFQRRKAEEAGKKIPTKMLAPMFICIFVPMLILLLSPVAFTINATM